MADIGVGPVGGESAGAGGPVTGVDPALDAEAGSGGIDDVRRLRAAARRDRQEWPFALIVLGLVVVLAAPFYVRHPFGPGSGAVRVAGALGPLADIGPAFSRLGQWAGPYWVVALVVAGLVIASHDRRAAARRGIAGPLWPVVATGLVLLVVLLALTPRILYLLDRTPSAPLSTAAMTAGMTLHLRGLTPLLLVGLVLVVLAWTERSAALAVIAVCYLALALVANLYDVENIAFRVGVMVPGGRYDALPNLLLPGVVLLVTGGVAALWRRGAR